MGYYVQITESTTVIPNENKAKVLHIWKTLNNPKFNSKKRGGGYSGGKQVSYWYSWMTEDYDQTCNTVEEILSMLGFDQETLASGDILVTGYDNKMGQEQVFFDAIAHLVNGQMHWVGESGEHWCWDFDPIIEPIYDETLFELLALK